MAVRIEPVDPSSERDLLVVADLATTYVREILGPDEPPIPVEEVHADLHVDRTDIDNTIILARDGGRAVGYVGLDVRVGMGNEHMAWVENLYVVSSHRRQGIGRTLLDEVVARARAAGRTLLLGDHAATSDAGAAFATAAGATPGNAEHQNRVGVADLDRAMLERWVDDAAESAVGYSLVSFDDRCPDELLDAMVRLAAVMNDAPRTEKLDDFVFDTAHRRADEAERAAVQASYWYVAARHDATGELAGYTELTWYPWKPWLVEQGDTGVVAAHRGHGIGRWLKAVNALRLLDDRPTARVIETWNDGTNRWMLAINDAMGFRPVATWIEQELEL